MINISVGEYLAAKIQAGQTCIIVPYNHMALIYPGVGPGFNLKLYGWVGDDPRHFLGEACTTGTVRQIIVTISNTFVGVGNLNNYDRDNGRHLSRKAGFDGIDHLRRFYHVTDERHFDGLVITFKLKPANND